MAVLEVKERTNRRRSSRSDGKTSHTRVFLVVCDSITDGTAVAMLADGIPREGDEHPQDGDTEANSIEASPLGNDPLRFEVTVQYETPENELQTIGQNADTHPLDRPWDITVNGSETVQAYFRDRSPKPASWNEAEMGPWTGKPVITSAGNPFDTLPERDASELQIEITRNEATRDIAADAEWSNQVNQYPVVIDGTTFAPGTLKLSPITSQRVVEQWKDAWGITREVTYYRYTYRLRARAETWADRMEDRDYVQLVPVVDDAGEPVLDEDDQQVREQTEITVKDENTGEQVPVRKPWPLDGAGLALKNPSKAPAQLTFHPYYARDFAPLNFS